jgi:DNA-binding winged helix-turn-helix (wHTH) protein/tetratricopeptide (TPR) repeat protein
MHPGPARDYGYRFGPFRVDLRTGELWNNGARLKLQERPFQLLAALLEHPGEMVSREDLQHRLWPADTFVDFDLGLNVAVQKLRFALSDSAEHPSYIETLASRGYRFIAPVEVVNGHVAANGVTLPAPATNGAAPTLPIARRKWLFASVALALVAVAAGVYTWLSRPPPLSFPNRGWVLIAKFENRTGEAIFDDTVEYALERELSNSRFVNLVPPERVQDAFRLMKKPSDTRLDASLAREVALRDGNVQVLLIGRTEKLGAAYVLSASLIEPSSGAVLRSFSEQAAGQNAVLAAVNQLSVQLREGLGEGTARLLQNPPGLEKATTPSLRALQLYSRGMAFVNQHNCEAAAQLLEQALAEDPDFPSAHIYLAHCYSNLEHHKEAAPHYQEAFRLAATTTDRERYFIVASYYERFVEDYEKAIQTYEVLVRLYPDHYWAVNNLALTLDEIGRSEEALPYFVARADLRPNDLEIVYRAWWGLRRSRQDPARADALMRKAQVLSQNPDAPANPSVWAATILYGSRHRMSLGDYQGALQEMERVRSSLPSYTGPRRQALTNRLGDDFFFLGQLRAAEELYSALPEDGILKHEGLAWVAEEWGDMTALRVRLRRQLALGADGIDPWRVRELARVGLLAEVAARLPDQRAQKSYEPPYVRLARAHIAIGTGRIPQAIDLLTELHGSSTASRDVMAFAVAIPLAQILEQRGDLAGAANILRQALEANPFPLFLTDVRRAKVHLARLDRKLGREEEARALESEVRQSLAVADPDHPILLQLNGLASSATAKAPVETASRR